MFHKKLSNRRIAVLAADGFEQVELTEPVKAFQNEGAEVEIVSLRPGKIVGMNLLKPGKKVRVDRTVGTADPADYDALLVPGGFTNPDMLRQSEAARNFVRIFDRAEKPIVTICHGPWVLVSAGLVKGRHLTSWPGIRDDVINAGGIFLDQPVVRDQNWVSSRGPHDLPAFIHASIDLFSSRPPVSAPREKKRSSAGFWLAGAMGLFAVVGIALRRAA